MCPSLPQRQRLGLQGAVAVEVRAAGGGAETEGHGVQGKGKEGGENEVRKGKGERARERKGRKRGGIQVSSPCYALHTPCLLNSSHPLGRFLLFSH